MKKKNSANKLTYKQYIKALIKSELERRQEDKRGWRYCVKDIDAIEGLPPIEKAEIWLKQMMVDGNLIEETEAWYSPITDNEFEDQESLIYFISRGADCSLQIQNMYARFSQQKEESKRFSKFIESCSDKDLRFLGLRKHKPHRKFDKKFAIEDAAWRSTPTIANDDQSNLTASMFRTIEWCDFGGFDDMLNFYSLGLQDDVARGGEIEEELASQFLFNICRSDLAIELMGENLEKLLEIVEKPDYQLTIPWHRWNRDEISLFQGGIKTNSILTYAASIVFSDKRLRNHKPNKELINQATKWLLENQEKNGAWKISTLLNYPSILGTCIVVHALAISKPRGWKLAVTHACDWLLAMQDGFGFWCESPFPLADPVYLTVLVLDTLELTKGSSKLTFGIDKEFNNLKQQDTLTALSQTIVVKGELVMGDKNIIGDNKGGIQNIGKFKNVSSSITSTDNKEFLDKLMSLMVATKNSQNLSLAQKDEHLEILNQLREELVKPQPNKTMLKMLGDGLLKALQVVPDLVKAATAIAPYLDHLPK